MSTKPRRQPKAKPKPRRPHPPSKRRLARVYVVLWAIIGLALTIGGTLIPAAITNVPWHWSEDGLQVHPLMVTCQVGAVLLVGCLGGETAGAIAQLAYLILGLFWQPIFTHGGGLEYIQEPTFGYLLGFIPGAWLCGRIAFRTHAKLETLALSSFAGLFTIHGAGVLYLMGLHLFSPIGDGILALIHAILRYSLYPLPGQLVVVCAVSVIAFFLRRILFY
ncbi:biotin transporter BioY [Spirulina sp. CS-785/01]|uniref:biotin transporter BioY n=1 Tax=Spirulina sp. CS-785/01 TaxID=3021716 RepID=UPI00232AA5EB|nr:biotin transporter BioY [Spirulina sp. CS-785/01]MDB9312390.1 biotin transporter BioY [Spirulina sp. CS-785/01]